MPMTLLRRLLPGIPWVHWLPVAALVALLAWGTSGLYPDFSARQMWLRTGLLAAALGLSFVFDDPAAPTTDPTPSPLRLRRGLRLAVSLIPWTLLVAVTLWAGSAGKMVARLALSPDLVVPQLPVGRLLLEAGAMASWGLGVASVLAKRWDEQPGKFASAAVLVLYGLAWAVPEEWKPWALPTANRWLTGYPFWWIALGLGVAVSAVAGWDSRSTSLGRRPQALFPPGVGEKNQCLPMTFRPTTKLPHGLEPEERS